MKKLIATILVTSSLMTTGMSFADSSKEMTNLEFFKKSKEVCEKFTNTKVTQNTAIARLSEDGSLNMTSLDSQVHLDNKNQLAHCQSTSLCDDGMTINSDVYCSKDVIYSKTSLNNNWFKISMPKMFEELQEEQLSQNSTLFDNLSKEDNGTTIEFKGNINYEKLPILKNYFVSNALEMPKTYIKIAFDKNTYLPIRSTLISKTSKLIMSMKQSYTYSNEPCKVLIPQEALNNAIKLTLPEVK